MIIIPTEHYAQDNKSDKTGNVYFSKSVEYDSYGYMRLATRSFTMMSQDVDPDFNDAVGIEFEGDDNGRIITSDQVFEFTVNSDTLSFQEDVAAPSMSTNSRSNSWQGRLYVTTNTGLHYWDGAVWTNAGVGLTGNSPHPLTLFRNRNEMAIGNNATVRLINTSHATVQTLQLPADMEVTHVVYNNNRIGVLTRTDGNSVVEDDEAYFFVWDGNTAEANSGVPVGTIHADTLCAYKSSWVVLNREGELLYYTGTGFQTLAAFPHYYLNYINGGTTINDLSRGPSMVADGDTILINLYTNIEYVDNRDSFYLEPIADGIWCYDPAVGLYHRYAPAVTRMRLSAANSVNIATDEITLPSALVPPTGMQILYSNDNTGINPLIVGSIYYVIKISATVMKLATTKANALLGVAIDLTSTGTANTEYFYIPTDLVDYGSLKTTRAFALHKVPNRSLVQDHIVFGVDIERVTSGSVECYMQTIPQFKNIGYWISPRLFSQNTKDAEKKLIVKHDTLKEGDRIIVKYKVKDYGYLPQSTTNTPGGFFTWTSTTTATTLSDLSQVKILVDAGKEIECELVSGAGAGQMSRVTSITAAGATYTVTIEDVLDGIVATYQSNAKFDCWRVAKVQTNLDTTNEEGYFEAPISEPSTWVQLKVVLEGFETTIQSMNLLTAPSQAET